MRGEACFCYKALVDYIVSQTNGVSPNKKADYPFRQSTLLFGLHAVFCLIELSRVTCWTVEIQSVFPASNFIILRRLRPSLRMSYYEFGTFTHDN